MWIGKRSRLYPESVWYLLKARFFSSSTSQLDDRADRTEDNGQTVTLYPLLPPPPRVVDIRTRESDDSSSLRTNATATGNGDTSIWAGMAPGFILPPPVFSRRGQPVRGVKGRSMNVIMPKKKSEVVADRTRRLAREMIDGPQSDVEAEVEVEVEQEGMEIEVDLEAEVIDRNESEVGVEEGSNSMSDMQLTGPAEIGTGTEQTLPTRSSSLANLIDTSASSSTALSIPKPLLEAPAEILEFEKPPIAPQGDDLVVAGLLDENLTSFEPNPALDEIREDEEIPTPSPSVGVDKDLPSPPLLEDQEDQNHGSPPPSLGVASFDSPIPVQAHGPVDSPAVPDASMDGEQPLPASSASPIDSPAALVAPTDDPMQTPPQRIRQSHSITHVEDTPPILAPLDTLPRINPPPPLGSRDLNIIPAPPPAPATPATALRKQKSLKQLLSFGYSSPPPPVPPLPSLPLSTAQTQTQVSGQGEPSRKRMTLLSRQSKPNLRVDVKSKIKSDNGPISAPLPATEVEREKEERPRMVKRFSLSNMSSAFKKMAGHSSHSGGAASVPKVPDLPAMYRRKSDQDVEQADRDAEERPRRRSEDDLSFRAIGSPIVREDSPICPLDVSTLLSPCPSPSASPSVPRSTAVPMVLEPAALLSQPIKPRLARSSSFSSLSSIATTASHEQQTLQHISPRTQRDPSASLQGFITQVHSTEVTIERPTHGRQRSLEATIVLSMTPPAPLPRSRLMEREDSLGNLSRSSHGSQRSSQESQTLKTPVTVPVASMSLDEIRRHIPIAPPRTVETVGEMRSEGSFKSLPSLGSEMIVVNSPTSTLASTSTGSGVASTSTASASGSRSASRASTPKARSLVRMITSPRRKHSRNTRTSQSKDHGKGKGKGKATQPPLPTTNSIKFDSLKQGVQLESLHFDSLDIDFSNLDWDSGLGTSTSTGRGTLRRR